MKLSVRIFAARVEPLTALDTVERGEVDPVSTDLSTILRTLKLSGRKDTLPERLALARQQQMATPRSWNCCCPTRSAAGNPAPQPYARPAPGWTPGCAFDTWNDLPDLTYDRALPSDLTTSTFTQAGTGVLLLGPVGAGKTHLATALGHAAIRRRFSVVFARADGLFTRLRAARLDNTLDAEIRRLTAVALRPLDPIPFRCLSDELPACRLHAPGRVRNIVALVAAAGVNAALLRR